MNSHIKNEVALKPMQDANIKAYEKSFVSIIRERLGIVIHQHQMRDLYKTIKEACQKFACTPEGYLEKIENSTEMSPLLEHLIAGITIGETYFFRDKQQVKLLQEKILPDLISAKRQNQHLSLRIWSAGCSSGEEIYTIAMMLIELLPDIADWTLNLLGTDINTLALKKALSGCYSDWSMRSIEQRLKDKYFQQNKKTYILNESLRNRVQFNYLNLNEETYPSIFNNTNAQDLILCRNVFIYFDTEHVKQVMKKLSLSLAMGGNLLLGASDPINLEDTNLVPSYKSDSSFAFGRVEQMAAEKTSSKPEMRIIPEIKSKSPQKIPVAVIKPKAPLSADQQRSIQTLLSEGRWQEILEFFDSLSKYEKNQASFLVVRATALANLGKIEDAKQVCETCIKLDIANVNAHFIFAMCLVELNQLEAAEAELRRTLYLDHQFVLGHYQLGLLLLRNMKYQTGLKSLTNALRIVKNQEAKVTVPGYPNLTYGSLGDILEHEIELYTNLRGGSEH